MRLLLSAFIALVLAAGGIAVYAQESQPEATELSAGPVYIVQAGDSLIGIAIRFGVTVDALMTVNNLADANQLFVGDRLVIPGLEGIEGVLETMSMPFGENLRSLSRRYQIPTDKLVKLNRLVSSFELVEGASLVLPVAEGKNLDVRRVALSPGETLLERAVIEGANPWQLVNFNQLDNKAYALPGDVLFVPGTQAEGPGALPSPILNVQVTDFYQGEVGIIRVQVEGQVALSGSFAGYTLNFFPDGEGRYIAFQGINALAEPNMYPFILRGTLPDGAPFAFTQMVFLRARDYIYEYITNVSPESIDPARTEPEDALLEDLARPVTPERLWDAPFLWPSPFEDCINSTFGNRRSYNGSAFTYYHGGVDFCGGTGVEINASASGIVVFAGNLEVVYGGYTLINHGWGIYSGYAHQSEILVEVGDIVEPGQVIGLIGNTGRSGGPHLHWEIWVGGERINPLNWIALDYP